jgi:hypothetical protein
MDECRLCFKKTTGDRQRRSIHDGPEALSGVSPSAGPQHHLQSKSENHFSICFDSFHFDRRQYFESRNPAASSQLTTQIALLPGSSDDGGNPTLISTCKEL